MMTYSILMMIQSDHWWSYSNQSLMTTMLLSMSTACYDYISRRDNVCAARSCCSVQWTLLQCVCLAPHAYAATRALVLALRCGLPRRATTRALPHLFFRAVDVMPPPPCATSLRFARRWCRAFALRTGVTTLNVVLPLPHCVARLRCALWQRATWARWLPINTALINTALYCCLRVMCGLRWANKMPCGRRT